MGRDLALAVISAAAIGILLHLYHDARSPGDRISGSFALLDIDGVDFISLSGPSFDEIHCRDRNGNPGAYWNCFRQTQKVVIVEFLRRRFRRIHMSDLDH